MKPKIALIKILDMIDNQDICTISAAKDSCAVVLKRTDYINKLETMLRVLNRVHM